MSGLRSGRTSTEAVLFEARDDGVAVITLNRPEALNALSRDVREGLRDAWARFEAEPSLGVAILTGAGDKAFCAGGDLREMAGERLASPPVDMIPAPGVNLTLTKPTIAAVNGLAYGAGWLLAQSCDLCIASADARFALPEVRIGRSPAWAAALIHMIPERIMLELLMTGNPITAERAYDVGLVNHVVTPSALESRALALAADILLGAPLAISAGRNLVRLATETGRTSALEGARTIVDRANRSDDAQEGAQAFLEKRRPDWRGR